MRCCRWSASDVFIEDLNSTNGTYINGKAVKKQLLTHNDMVEIGKYKIKYLLDDSADYEKTQILRPGSSAHAHAYSPPSPAAAAPQYAAAPAFAPMPSVYGSGSQPRGGSASSGFGALDGAAPPALIKVLNGAAAGREVTLTKVVTTVGKPGVQVASITRRPTGYVFAHVEGVLRPSVNGTPVIGETVALRNGDVIELAGTQMQFVQG